MTTSVSSLSADSSLIETPESSIVIINNDDLSETVDSSTVSTQSSNTNNTEVNTGRPRVSTQAQKYELDARKRDAIGQVAIRYKRVQDLAKERGTITRKCEYQNLVSEICQEFNLPDLKVNKNCILSRICRGNLTKRKTGINPLLLKVEPLLIDSLVQKSKMGQPVNMGEGLEMVNSLFEGTL